jgi:transposase
MQDAEVDVESVRNATLEAYQRGPGAVVNLVTKLAAQIENLSTRMAALEADNATLRAKLDTNSRNSSKPLSSDGPGVKPHPKRQRPQAERKTGGQPGHRGHHVALVEDPDEVELHAPMRCAGCGRSLEGLPVVEVERRQIIDIPPIRPYVVEHRAETKRCPDCGTETSGGFPAGLAAPVQYGPNVLTTAVYLNQEQLLPEERTCEVLADLFQCPLSVGTLERAVGQCFGQLARPEAAIRQAVEQASVAHFGETGLNIAGHNHWLHVASTARLTFYASHAKRGRAAMTAIGVLKNFHGRAIHDGLAGYWQFAHCQHGLCNAHHLRELTFVAEELQQPWAAELKTLLLDIKRDVNRARAENQTALAPEVKVAFSARYATILATGLTLNPPPQATGQRGRPKRGKAGSLVDRLRQQKEATLAFMEDFSVPFDNNQAERDIRMTKTRQKVSGCFRTTEGARRFCRIRGYISTLRKQGVSILSALAQAIVRHPPLPPDVQVSSPE